MPVDPITEARRARDRRNAEAKRRRNGIAPVKGTEINCRVCGVTVIRKSQWTVRCVACQREHVLADAREKSRKKRQSAEGRASLNAWSRKRRRESPAVRVSAHCTTMIHRALGKGKAGRSWRTFVDFTLEELVSHLERQFVPGMSWQNMGEWHIDHIVPQSAYQFESADDPDFRRCWALPNLRPLWGRDNQRKQAKRTHLI